MADDITLSTNIGSGSVIATEDESGVHYQKIKLTASGNGTTEDLSKAEDTAHTTGDHGIMALAVRSDDLAALAGTDGDYTPLQVDALGAVYQNQGNRISADGVNSRAAATLLASATFQGTSEDVSAYGRVGVSIVSDNATDGTLTMEVSRDGSTWGGPDRTWADTRFAQPHMWNIVEKYFRIKYVNGTTEATNLQIQVQYSNNANILLGHQLDATLINETESIVVRSVAVGQDPNDAFINESVSGVSDGNSSTTNLTSGTSLVFTGTWGRVDGYHGITVLVDGTSSGDVSGTLQMQFSHDGSTVHRDISVNTSTVTNVLPRTLGVVAKYFRIIYTAAADLISFDAQTMFHNEQVVLVSRLDGALQGSEDVANVRSVIVAQDPDGTYINTTANQFGALEVEPEQHVDLDEMDSTSGWTVLGNDTTTLATSSNHILGSASLSFAKVDGAANTIFAGIQKTITAVDLGDVSPHDLFQVPSYVADEADISYAFIRIGTDSSNYNEWRIDGANLTGGDWEILVFNIGDASFSGSTGNGWDQTAITYIAVGYAFNSQTDTLAGILFDALTFHTNQHTSASLNSEVTSSVSSSNVNINKVGNKVVNTEAGNVGTGTQRITIATDDANLASINTDAGTIAGAVSGSEMQVDIVAALPAGTNAIGKLSANSGVDIGDVDITSIAAGTNLIGITGIDQVTSNANEVVTKTGSLVALEAGTAAFGKLSANSGVDIGDVDVTSISAGTNVIGDVGISGARTSGGTSFFYDSDLDETKAQVKGSAGQIYWIHAINLDSTPIYLQIFDLASASVTVGTTTPSMQFVIPSQGDSNGAGFNLAIPNGIAMGTGITVAATTDSEGSTGPGASEVIVNIGYA